MSEHDETTAPELTEDELEEALLMVAREEEEKRRKSKAERLGVENK